MGLGSRSRSPGLSATSGVFVFSHPVPFPLTRSIKWFLATSEERVHCSELHVESHPLHSSFIRTFFLNNVEDEIYSNFKKMLRTYPRLRVGERLYFAHLF